MKWKYISTYEIEKIINSLNSKNSNGYDDITNRVIKISAPFIISPLTYICNAIFKNRTFPERLKYAMFTPILKKRNQHEVSNYRPISLLTAFSKIVEKTVFKILISHLEKNNLLAEEQFRFS